MLALVSLTLPFAAQAANPVYAPGRWAKDPFVLHSGRDYYLYTTDVRKLHAAHSSDLIHWSDDREVAIEGETAPFVWAASVVERGGEYFLYYTAGGELPGGGIDWPTFRIRVARGERPQGPYKSAADLIDAPRPFAGQDDAGLIDPEVVAGDDGTLYCFYVVVLRGIPGKRFYWEGIRVRRLKSPIEADPASPDTRVIDPGSNDTWQQNIVEAPTIVRIGKGKWALLYSGGSSQKGQAVGIAYADRLMGAGGGGDASWRMDAGGSHPEGVALLRPQSGWSAASLGSTAAASDPKGRLKLVYQGLDKAEAPGVDSHWAVGVRALEIKDGRLRIQ